MTARPSIPPRPVCPPFTGLPDLPAIATLRGRDQWVSWDYVWKPDRAKWDKPPLDPSTGGAGSSTNAATWSSYAQAAHRTAKEGFAGVGFVLAPDDGTTGIDLDKCRDADTGEIDTWAAEIIGFAETYTEVSPSGQGIRLFADGKVARTFLFAPANVEVYAGGRYLTVTGQHVAGTPTEILPAPRTIEALRNRVENVRGKIEAEKAAEAPQIERESPSRTGDNFFRGVNRAAIANLISWVPSLFGPAAKYIPRTGAYRVTSRALGRDLEEDLSITPGGIVDFGVHDLGDRRSGKRTSIDLVMEHGGAGDAPAAARWLCEQMGVDPATLGWQDRKAKGDQAQSEPEHPGTPEPALLWFGDKPPVPLPWLVEKTLPQTGVAILAGQSGVSKTFVAIELAACVMTQTSFAGREVRRAGAVLFLAAEGEEEVDARMLGVVNGKLRATLGLSEDKEVKLPFARQASGVPQLTEADALDKLLKLTREFQDGLATRFPDTDLALIIVDTIAAAAGFQDENSAAETQRVMNVLRSLSRQTGALVMVIDHYGKLVETGVRGSSAKQAAADAVLAVIGDKDQVTGKVTNRRLVVVKSRGSATGAEVPFDLRLVPVGAWGSTTCVVEWKVVDIVDLNGAKPQKEAKPAWSGNARVLKSAIERAMIEHGADVRPWGAGQTARKAVEHDRVRAEFYGSYPAEPEAKRKAFNRMIKDAVAKELIGAREIAGTDWIWLAKDQSSETGQGT